MSDHVVDAERPPYPYELCKKALRCVFDSVEFKNPRISRIMRHSYFANLGLMLKYAYENHIDELEYILDIRDILLKKGCAHEI